MRTGKKFLKESERSVAFESWSVIFSENDQERMKKIMIGKVRREKASKESYEEG